MAKKLIKSDQKREILRKNGWVRKDRGNEERWIRAVTLTGRSTATVPLNIAWRQYLAEKEGP